MLRGRAGIIHQGERPFTFLAVTSFSMKKLILVLKDIVFVLFDAGERVLGHEHTGKDRSRWQEEGRRKCTVQGWKIRKSFKEIREGLNLILVPLQCLLVGFKTNIKLWLQGVKYIEYDSAFDEEDKKKAKALKIACNLNDAACKLKLKDYKEAAKLCTKVKIKDFSFSSFGYSNYRTKY